MKIGVSVFLTGKSGNPGDIAQTAENLGFDSFWVAEHIAIPTQYKTHYPRSADGKTGNAGSIETTKSSRRRGSTRRRSSRCETPICSWTRLTGRR